MTQVLRGPFHSNNWPGKIHQTSGALKTLKMNFKLERGNSHKIQQSMTKEIMSKVIHVWKDQHIKSLLHDMHSLVINMMLNTMNKSLNSEKIYSD